MLWCHYLCLSAEDQEQQADVDRKEPRMQVSTTKKENLLVPCLAYREKLWPGNLLYWVRIPHSNNTLALGP